MKFADLAANLDLMEATSSRNELVRILSEVYRACDVDELEPITYLIQGRLAPFFEPIEIRLGETLLITTLAPAYSVPKHEAPHPDLRPRPARAHTLGEGRDGPRRAEGLVRSPAPTAACGAPAQPGGGDQEAGARRRAAQVRRPARPDPQRQQEGEHLLEKPGVYDGDVPRAGRGRRRPQSQDRDPRRRGDRLRP